MATLYKSLLKVFDAVGEIKYKLNCLYSQVISFHCSKYNNIINTEDCKEFYLAKIQLYAIE
jgi:kinesin family protein 18/19